MTSRRELISGLIAALLSIFLVFGSLLASFAENGTAVGLKQPELQTATPTVPTRTPGGPSLTPSDLPTENRSPTISPTASCNYPSNWVAVLVSPGDTLESLAKDYDTTINEIIEANCLVIETITAGTVLYVPAPKVSVTPTKTTTPRPAPTRCPGPPPGWVFYTVQAGDNLYAIGRAYGVSVLQLQNANCLGYNTTIRTGQLLRVPNVATRTPLPSPTGTQTPSATPTLLLPTQTASSTNISTATATGTVPPASATATHTPTTTPTVSKTTAPTTNTPTNTATPAPADTNTPVPSATATNTP